MSLKQRLFIEKPYAVLAQVVLDKLGSSLEGLSSKEAKGRLKDLGPNRLPEPIKENILKKFFKHFHNLLIYILIVAGVVTATLGHWIDAGVILAVVIINSAIGFIQEGKAEQALKGIQKMLSLHAQVRRSGKWLEVEATELVFGDIVRLRSGDKVPADLRLIEAVNLRIEESLLTGESLPVEKNIEAIADNAPIADRRCIAYSGTMVSSGRGVGVVTATGASTEIGRINKMIAEVKKIATPLTRQINKLSKFLSVAIVSLAGLIFFIGYFFHSFSFEELFLAAIGFAVAAIPEGLPAILTIILALGVLRMARRNAITRKINAVETLGSVTTICSDKTGTLTRNEMTVRFVVTTSGFYEASGTGYKPEGKIFEDQKEVLLADKVDLEKLIEVMAVCNDSEIRKEDSQWKITGEPMEAALLVLAKKAGFSNKGYQRLAQIPFESENKFMATLNRLPQKGAQIMVKGAPNKILDFCKNQQGSKGSLERLDRDFWQKQIELISSKGLRVLAAAKGDISGDKKDLKIEDISENMVFLGIVGIFDPPRPEAIKAIKICHQAGIAVKMITGDHAGTAKAIGWEMGIGKGKQVFSGSQVEALSDKELCQVVKDIDIFARTSPEHKLRVVKALQANGEVVAMTGDGVNDAPSLKRADVGVAMGIKGTEVTRQAADIVLADDNFTSIEQAIEEGRTIYDNLRKAILFILPTNGAEALVILVAIIAGLVLPLTPVQILWVNMVTAVTLALALAFEPAESGLMHRPPREPDAPILSKGFLWRIGFVSLLIGGATIVVFLIEKQNGPSLELARTLAVNTLVFSQVFYLFNSRFLKQSSLKPNLILTNPAVWIVVLILVLLQLGFVYFPFMNLWFGSVGLGGRHWLLSLGVGLVIFLIIEVEKALASWYN